MSCKVSLPDPSDHETDEDNKDDIPTTASDLLNDGDGDIGQIKYVVGDLTKPLMTGVKDRIIAHCVGKPIELSHTPLCLADMLCGTIALLIVHYLNIEQK